MLRKFAAFDVLEATLAPEGGAALRSYAHRHSFTYDPRPGYLYIRSRAISSRTNDNFDTFPAEEIEKGYLSFIGKPVFVNHNNDNHRRARGVIIDAALHRDRNPDGSPDTWSEVLMEVDAVRFPKLAKAILAGHIDRTSMGTDVSHSICSFCGNKATTPLEYCKHIPKMKGQRIYRTTASGTKEGVLVSEICHGLKFFENSLLVEEPADPTAFFTGVEGHGVAKTAAKVEPLTFQPLPIVEMPVTASGPHATTNQSDKSTNDTDSCATCGKAIYHVEGSGNAGWQHDIDGASGVPHQAFPKGKTASIYLTAVDVPVSKMSPAQLKSHRRQQAAGKRWNKANPVHVDNVIDHWNAATDHERHVGMNWYADAHHITKHIANDTGHDMTTAAGLMSNYSPQTHWASNMINASKAMRAKKGIGGGGSGIFASHQQRKAANKMMGTEGEKKTHYDDVLGGPKTKAFAHLIEHGGNKDPEKPHVVIDRHALSVAAGKRATDVAYSYSGLGGIKKYKKVADTYHQAAKHISKVTGVKVEAHQVQAATWLARQRMNSAEDQRVGSNAKTASAEWDSYAGEHHPMAMGKEPGTGYAHHQPEDQPEDVKHSQDLHDEGGHGGMHTKVPVTNPRRLPRTDFGRTAAIYLLAYGETMAPADVDTLRDEECPVCGETDAYDGNRCDVCGFDAPPKMFQDPNLDMAKQLDLRKDIMQDQSSDPNGDGMPDVVPGSGQMGTDAIAPGADQIPDPDDVAQQQMNQIGEEQAPLQPEELDENGQPVADADPMAQALPQDPNAMPIEPEDIAGEEPVPGQEPMPGEEPPIDPEQMPMDTEGEPEPGTPGDAAADLICPVCGYQQGAEPPQTVDTGSPAESVAGAEGSLCPNCGQAPLMSIKSADQMQNAQGQAPVQVQQAMGSRAFPVITL